MIRISVRMCTILAQKVKEEIEVCVFHVFLLGNVHFLYQQPVVQYFQQNKKGSTDIRYVRSIGIYQQRVTIHELASIGSMVVSLIQFSKLYNKHAFSLSLSIFFQTGFVKDPFMVLLKRFHMRNTGAKEKELEIGWIEGSMSQENGPPYATNTTNYTSPRYVLLYQPPET